MSSRDEQRVIWKLAVKASQSIDGVASPRSRSSRPLPAFSDKMKDFVDNTVDDTDKMKVTVDNTVDDTDRGQQPWTTPVDKTVDKTVGRFGIFGFEPDTNDAVYEKDVQDLMSRDFGDTLEEVYEKTPFYDDDQSKSSTPWPPPADLAAARLLGGLQEGREEKDQLLEKDHVPHIDSFAFGTGTCVPTTPYTVRLPSGSIGWSRRGVDGVMYCGPISPAFQFAADVDV